MFDVLLSVLPPQAASLAESTKVKSPTVEHVVLQNSPKSSLKLTGVAPESLPPELLAKRKMEAFYPMKAKAAIAAGLPLQQTGTDSSQMPIDPKALREKLVSSEVTPLPAESTSQDKTTELDDKKRKALEAAKAERRKLLEQKLAEIVAKEKALREARLRQNLKDVAVNQAKVGQVDEARQTAQDFVLTDEEQTELLNEIDQLAKRQPVAKKPDLKKSLQVTRLNQGQPGIQGTPYYPSYVVPGSVLGSNIRLSQLGWKLSNGNLSLAFPLPFPAQLISGFGWRIHPITGDRRFHRGVDLAAAYGTPVIAAFSGKVDVADWMDGYGMTIILTHKNSTQTLYAHLSQIFVKPGDTVEQGTLIGLVGSTGLATGPHLHFELHQLTDDGWAVIDPAIQLEIAETRLANGMQIAQIPPQVSNLPQPFAAIPPPPTQKFDFLHNF
jgi:murein DD-endopeptidase MepM/ murein hydrolase activator NlpD